LGKHKGGIGTAGGIAGPSAEATQMESRLAPLNNNEFFNRMAKISHLE
jgi:hypothetical protein